VVTGYFVDSSDWVKRYVQEVERPVPIDAPIGAGTEPFFLSRELCQA
jgi:hypothetical protein